MILAFPYTLLNITLVQKQINGKSWKWACSECCRLQEVGTGASRNLWFSKCVQQLHSGPRDVFVCVCVCLINKIEKNEMGWTCGAYGGEERGVYRVLVGKPERKRPLGRPRRRWVDNIRMDLQEVGCGYMDWIGLAQDRDSRRAFVSAVMKLRVPWNAGNFLTGWEPVSFSRRTLRHAVS